jgi:hypothetical protein
MIIKIKQPHIKSAVRCSCFNDPVAIAMRELGYKNVTVGASKMTYSKVIDDKLHETDVELPENIAETLAAFDRGEKIKPFSFELED